MIAIAYYLLKVTIISGLLFGFYHLALKDKVFHQWNRFYLLATVILSLVMPLVSFTFQTSGQQESGIITALQVVSGTDELVSGYKPEPSSFITTESLLTLCYLLVSLVMMGVLLMAITRIISITRKYKMLRLDDIYFLNTHEPGTPFSFFKYIFWNEDIDINSPSGRRIFEHEMVHVREHHSLDKIFLQFILVTGWINPFFWLIRSELNMIHEFIADRKSIGEKNSIAFAELILQSTYPKYNHLLSNPFFQNSIKRRLSMINKSKHPGMNYLSRISALVIATCILLAFTLKPKATAVPITMTKKITVVIDASHGGTDNGSVGGILLEKDISLQIASQVKSLNRSPNIEVILTRETDIFMNVREKLDFSINHNADLFISIHVNAAPPVHENGVSMGNSKSGFDVYISKNNTTLTENNLRLATILLQNMSNYYSTNSKINIRDRGTWVLDRNNVPGAILECGYITNPQDRDFISNPANQKTIAENILRSVEQYFSGDVILNKEVDTLPGKSTSDKNPASAKTISSKNTSNHHQGVISVSSTSPGGQIQVRANQGNAGDSSLQVKITGPEPLYVVDGTVTAKNLINNIDPNKISSIDILKGDAAVKEYGENGKNGVVRITTKK
jgi:N-acetylmuramoyl-L-alanine amidase